MVADARARSPALQLESSRFAIIGLPTERPGWYEFTAVCNGLAIENIGGQAKRIFVDQMISVLENDTGLDVNSVPHAAFSNILCGNDARYLGHVVLSGYNTFYFFREGMLAIHVVLADGRGTMFAHERLSSEEFGRWRRQLKKIESTTD